MTTPALNPTGEFEKADAAAQFILARIQATITPRPKIALVLGSGLGGFADALADSTAIDYAEIPHYPQATAIGHAGRLVIGSCAGVPLAAMQGRVHFYEGISMKEVVLPMRVFGRMGVQAA